MKKILIVEDDTFLKNLAAKKLTSVGFDVATAADAVEASAAIDKAIPDLVLLDLLFPGDTDGFGMLKKIRENTAMQQTPVIIFSNMSDENDMQKAKDLGATDYMVKSNFTLDELVEKVKGLTGNNMDIAKHKKWGRILLLTAFFFPIVMSSVFYAMASKYGVVVEPSIIVFYIVWVIIDITAIAKGIYLLTKKVFLLGLLLLVVVALPLFIGRIAPQVMGNIVPHFGIN